MFTLSFLHFTFCENYHYEYPLISFFVDYFGEVYYYRVHSIHFQYEVSKCVSFFFTVVLQNSGLFGLVDEESNFPMATDKSLVEKLNSRLKENEKFQQKARLGGKADFSIQHYAGTVSVVFLTDRTFYRQIHKPCNQYRKPAILFYFLLFCF